MVPVLLHSTVNHPSQLVACTHSLQSQHANNRCLLLLKACSSMPLILLKRHNSILYSDYLFNGLPLISEIHLLLLVDCNIICVQKNMDNHQTLGKGPGGQGTNVHTCMHICTYFCVSGPFGTHPPLAVQKYTWYFCAIGKNMDTHPQNGTFVQKMHGTFVFSGQSGPPPPKIFTKILPKKFDKKLIIII